MRNIIDMLLYEASKRPHIKELVDKITTLSDEDIECAYVPLPWYRKALIQYREQKLISLQFENDTIVLERTNVPEIHGTIKQYLDQPCFLSLDGRLPIDISTGDLFFVPDDGGIWYRHMFGSSVNVVLHDVRKATRQDYANAVAGQLTERYGHDIEKEQSRYHIDKNGHKTIVFTSDMFR